MVVNIVVVNDSKCPLIFPCETVILTRSANPLSGTKEYAQELCPKIRLSEKHSSLDVHTYVDSDWAGDPDTRRSTSGVATYLLGVNLQSHSRTQQTIALSSGEAEL